MKILMVCLGNICRSPLAEGIMRAKIVANGLAWQVDSAGTSGHHHGKSPDSRSIKVAFENGIDITEQRSRKLTTEDLKQFDLICAMDSSNYNNILRITPSGQTTDHIDLIMNFANPGMNINVTDPYYGEEGFDRVYEMLEEACDAIIHRFNTI